MFFFATLVYRLSRLNVTRLAKVRCISSASFRALSQFRTALRKYMLSAFRSPYGCTVPCLFCCLASFFFFEPSGRIAVLFFFATDFESLWCRTAPHHHLPVSGTCTALRAGWSQGGEKQVHLEPKWPRGVFSPVPPMRDVDTPFHCYSTSLSLSISIF